MGKDLGILWCDFETRSHCDLKARGVYNYAQHPTTEVLCLSYAFDDEPVETWTPERILPPEVRGWTGQIRAHNAAFERLIFKHVLGVPYALEQFYCTAAQARSNCAPGSLEDVGRFAGASMKKDHRGNQLIRKLCVYPYIEDEALLAELIAYCEQDVRAMRAISQAMRQLTDEELRDYHVNERINDRGVRVDVPLCRAAMRYAKVEAKDIEARVVELTEGAVRSVRSPKMRQWVLDRLGAEARKLCVKDEKDSIDKSVRANLLAIEDHEQVPPDVREVIQCADDIWASSVAKFQRLADLAGDDGRLRGAFVFAGGAATGRASSYGAQVHNFTRKASKNPEVVREDIVAGRALVPTHGARGADVLRSMLRPALVPARGHVFVAADWSAIEGRVNPWLAATDAGERKLDVFRERRDPYKVNASATYGVAYEDVTDEQRQVGKVQELALGFAGGVGAFAAMGRGYGIHIPEAQARRIVDAWRRVNPWAVRFWADLESAYVRAMRYPGREFSAGRISYLYDGAALWYVLPSGRLLCYPQARFDEDGGISYAKAAWKPAVGDDAWPRARLWPGLGCENCVQATAHDLLRHALRVLPQTILTVHDEIVLEVLEADADDAAQRLSDAMCTPPAWAEGLPLTAEVKILKRYGK